MNTDFYWRFVNTLMLNLATIAAVVVAVVSFTYRGIREWYTNGGKDMMVSNTCKLLQFVNKTAERLYYQIEESETVNV